MQNLIDHTYFIDELQLANVNTDADVQAALSNTIARKQYEFLNLLLGNDLYLQLIQWYAVNPADTTNNFYYLLNGKSFSYYGRNTNWIGLTNSVLKLSPLANYVYYYKQAANTTQTTSPGEAKVKSQNADSASAIVKMCEAWNKMAEMLEGYLAFMNTFYEVNATTLDVYNALPYKAPVQITAGTTPGFISGATTFVFDGLLGTADWRGYNAYPERIGQGTMLDSSYTWNPTTGRFSLLDVGDTFQPSEVFNFTFGLGGVTFNQISNYTAWVDYVNFGSRNEVFRYKNSIGI